MLKSMNRDNDDFFCNSRNIKNSVDNVNKHVTLSIAHKSNINTDKRVNDPDIQNNNNFAIPADTFNRDNEKGLAQSSDIFINENIIRPSLSLCGGSQINTPQNVRSETEYNHRTSSS